MNENEMGGTYRMCVHVYKILFGSSNRLFARPRRRRDDSTEVNLAEMGCEIIA
jgi:hypothetical protein